MIKRIQTGLLTMLLCTFVAFTGCTQNSMEASKGGSGVSITVSEDHQDSEMLSSTEEKSKEPLQTKFEKMLDKYQFEGVMSVMKDGVSAVSIARGTLENGEAITIDTPMPVGSISKQFCAAAILLLQEQGKLSTEDTLGKYFPEYEAGKDIPLSLVLSHRSGVPDIPDSIHDIVSVDKSYEENTDLFKEWHFALPLSFEPDRIYSYSNSNFFLLADIIEQVSGKKYIDFLRENILTPLGMEHTGSISELSEKPAWLGGITFEKVDLEKGLTKGSGDIISNAADISKWLNALTGGNVLSDDSYQQMITDYSPEEGYGYGIRIGFFGGIGHNGQIGDYYSVDLIDTDDNTIIYMVSCNLDSSGYTQLLYDIPATLRE